MENGCSFGLGREGWGVKKFFLLLFCVVLAGCVSSGTNYDPANVAKIVKGVSTEADCVALLGQPTTRVNQSDGTVLLMWMHVKAHATAGSYIPVVGGIVTGGAKASSRQVLVTIGQDKKVIQVIEGDSQSHIKIGVGG